MSLVKNNKFDFIEIDNDNYAIFDPDTGNTHIIEASGADILKQIDGINEKEDIIKNLKQLYDITSNEISDDVTDFINSLIEKKIVIES
ncbi:MAG: hypothetical protein A2Y40_06505 [Candidatus Margulisbacteria bacterium GWF2_35_9]|nr:MAG: hypothetical protein A2Y40_06505 [Candidatus Margulisbacteria bacterium GWF2_35_9]